MYGVAANVCSSLKTKQRIRNEFTGERHSSFVTLVHSASIRCHHCFHIVIFIFMIIFLSTCTTYLCTLSCA